MSLLEYQCPSCGGAVAFDGKAQKLVCPFCDSEFTVEEMNAAMGGEAKEVAGEPEWKTPDAQWGEDEQGDMRVFSCKSCGGEIVGDVKTASTICPYCDSPVVMTGQLSGVLKPDIVVPFKLGKEEAKAALQKHYSGKPLLPRVFKSENNLDEIKGLYVPFWLFDTDVRAHIEYIATRVRHWEDRNYQYTETSRYRVTREGVIAFDNIPVDGSSKMDDAMMESIEPFNWGEAVDFQTAYLAGYMTDKYDVDDEQSIGRANARLKASTEEAFASTVVGYNSVSPQYSDIRTGNGRVRYGLLPVWLLNTSRKGKKYTFTVNGQTGTLAGSDLPVDKSILFKWLLGITAAVTVVAYVGSVVALML